MKMSRVQSAKEQLILYSISPAEKFEFEWNLSISPHTNLPNNYFI